MTLAMDRLAAGRRNRTAIVDDTAGHTISYPEFADGVAELAARLAGLGVESGDRVAVVSRNRVETIAGVFAARRLGAALAPVSPRLGHGGVDSALATLDPAVVLHEAATRDLVRGRDDAASFDDLDDVESAEVDGEPVNADRDRPLLFVHDDEGERAAGFSAAAVEVNCASVATAWGLGRTDATLQIRQPATAAGLLQVALPVLYAGGTLVVHRAFDPPDVLGEVESFGATYLVASGKELRETAGHPEFEDADLSTLEWVATADDVDAEIRAAFDAPTVRTWGDWRTGPNALYAPAGTDAADGAERAVPFPDAEVRLVAHDGDAAEGAVAVGGRTVATAGVGWEPPDDGWVRTEWRAASGDDGFAVEVSDE